MKKRERKTFPKLVVPAFLLLGALNVPSAAQWRLQTSHSTARLRGISAVSSTVAWASGSGGTVLRTTDGGATWTPRPIPGGEALDFRDIEAFDADTAYVLSIGEGEKSRIYKTTDGGIRWALQFTNPDPKAFYDAFAFWDRDHGIAMSDPVDGRFVLIRTTDGGASWRAVAQDKMPKAVTGEGGFAASGTCIAVHGNDVWFATGGSAARVFRSTDRGVSWRVAPTPIISGEAASGIFSIAFANKRDGFIVGGNYRQEGESKNNAALTADGGITWNLVSGARPGGYRSAVAYVPGALGRELVAVGPSGTDCSNDGGLAWVNTGHEGFDAVSFARAGGAGWAAGDGGKIARFTGESCPKSNSSLTPH